jgi:NADH-quinone oxidoreductase subunit L
MTLPLMILAGLAIVGGFLGIPQYSLIEHWLAPIVAGPQTPHHGFGLTEVLLAVISTAVVVSAILFTQQLYRQRLSVAAGWATRWPKLYQLSQQKWYWDEICDVKFVKLLSRLTQGLWWSDRRIVDTLPNGSAASTWLLSQISLVFDRAGIDFFVNFTGWLVRASSVPIRLLQTGLANDYGSRYCCLSIRVRVSRIAAFL